ncbi:GNAT family N-acetyltransferase [Streptomyces yaizuensis]|uniref:GNAT family N-acetyltransferase n=1 Tax=Streptomyces yaizuensis TaxID=2989713 RepID=A0ABQ5NTK8_9ACTN|nr:GNAT family N-acetyltransferase [Streptomyces sp. YSPA8]GLF93694.1 GNAT family N-acetyltransferase [Streptomyces sp. YSPA8]
MTSDLRPLAPQDWEPWYEALRLAYGGAPVPPERRALRAAVAEYDRALGIWDGGECVATALSYSFRMAVPGTAREGAREGTAGGGTEPGAGFVPTAAVSMIGVLPTHRRRGLLTALMRRQLDDIRERGEPLAALTASEPAIYGRYGYGIASRQLSLEIDTARAGLTAPPGGAGIRLRPADPAAAAPACAAVRDRLAPRRPGATLRPAAWEPWPLHDPATERGGGSELRCVLAERDGAVTGHALFHVRPEWQHTGPTGTVVLRELEALDPASVGALWHFVLGIDLTTTVQAFNRPPDEPLLHLVADPRRLSPRLRDGLHLRLVDVGAALAARTYRVPVDAVLEVTDPFCPWNTGRWRLSGDSGGAVCAPTRDAADVSLSVRELAAAYLGGTPLRELAGAGLVREVSGGTALACLSTAFGGGTPPWLAYTF